MASLESSNSSPPNPSFAIRGTPQNKFLRSLSTKVPSFSEFPYTPPRRHASPNLTRSLQNSPVSSPLHPQTPTKLYNVDIDHDHDYDLDHLQTAYHCVSSVLKKDGQILSIAVSAGLAYTGSNANLIRVWKLPEFTECGQIKTKACMVVAIEVCNDKVYAAYGDGKIRVWRRTWDRVLKHIRLATIPNTGGYVRSYIAGSKDKTVKHLGPITSLAINLRDDILYSSSIDKTVKVWCISDLKCIETIKAHSEPINAIVLDDGGVLYTASDDATIKVWRRNFSAGLRPHSLTVTLPAKYSPIKTLTLTRDNTVLYGGCNDGYIHYWIKGWFPGQLQYGGALQGHTHAIMCLASVGNYVISGSADSTSRVWSREEDGQHTCLAVLVGHRGPIRCVTAFAGKSGEDSEDSYCMVCTGSLDGVLKMWHVTCKNMRFEPANLRGGVSTLVNEF
ncbi:Myosin heavy chain kinase B-like [Quillaja saponaria]|uniref:Myosin heavy chain kinase B-like n=1 Tax=Quillaja saponaria TaxID=32244 RepID=A0AAD7PEE1_QUISA|nr:Myosin heavy chain kinase B-like [Quillaja saponaria]